MSGLAPNSRSRRIEESATLAISDQANQLKAAGHDVVSLGAGEPDFDAPEAIERAAITAIERGNYRYTAAAGTKELRAAGADWLNRTFGLDYQSSEVMVCAGAKGALHMSLDTIVEKGDKVLLLAPYWVSYPALLALADAEPVVVPPAPHRGFVHDVADVESAAVASDARGIIVNFPNNPSGAVPTRADVEALVDMCRRRDLWIISDEIYSLLLYDGAEHVSPAAVPGGRERTIVINGFTKSHTLTGWRTSFLAGPEDIVATAARIQSQVLGNACTISQAAMLEACQRPLPENLAERREAFSQRRDYLVEHVNRIPGMSLQTPRGAFYALVDIRPICTDRRIDDLEACRQLLAEQHLAVVPGSAFAADGFIRLSYAASLETLKKAVARLSTWADPS